MRFASNSKHFRSGARDSGFGASGSKALLVAMVALTLGFGTIGCAPTSEKVGPSHRELAAKLRGAGALDLDRLEREGLSCTAQNQVEVTTFEVDSEGPDSVTLDATVEPKSSETSVPFLSLAISGKGNGPLISQSLVVVETPSGAIQPDLLATGYTSGPFDSERHGSQVTGTIVGFVTGDSGGFFCFRKDFDL